MSLHADDLDTWGISNKYHQQMILESLQRLQQQAALYTLARRGHGGSPYLHNNVANRNGQHDFISSNIASIANFSAHSHNNINNANPAANYQSSKIYSQHSNVNDGFFV